jgi:hypothetical protein
VEAAGSGARTSPRGTRARTKSFSSGCAPRSGGGRRGARTPAGGAALGAAGAGPPAAPEGAASAAPARAAPPTGAGSFAGCALTAPSLRSAAAMPPCSDGRRWSAIVDAASAAAHAALCAVTVRCPSAKGQAAQLHSRLHRTVHGHETVYSLALAKRAPLHRSIASCFHRCAIRWSNSRSPSSALRDLALLAPPVQQSSPNSSQLLLAWRTIVSSGALVQILCCTLAVCRGSPCMTWT